MISKQGVEKMKGHTLMIIGCALMVSLAACDDRSNNTDADGDTTSMGAAAIEDSSSINTTPAGSGTTVSGGTTSIGTSGSGRDDRGRSGDDDSRGRGSDDDGDDHRGRGRGSDDSGNDDNGGDRRGRGSDDNSGSGSGGDR
jgi:hypothetical protein